MPTPPTRTGPPPALHGYQAMVLGQAVSVVGTWAFGFALAWTVLQTTGSAVLVALVLACSAAPGAVLQGSGQASGSRRVLLASSAASVVVYALAALTLTGGTLRLYLLCTLVLCAGALETVQRPAYTRLLTSVIQRGDLEQVLRREHLWVSGAKVVGSLVAALALLNLGLAWVAVLAAISSLPLALATLTVQHDETTTDGPVTVPTGSVREGLRALRSTRYLRSTLTVFLAGSASCAQVWVLLPVLVREVGGGVPVLAALGVVCVAGTVAGGTFLAGEDPAWRLVVGAVVAGVGALGTMTGALAMSAPLVALMLLVQTVGTSTWLSATATCWLTAVPVGAVPDVVLTYRVLGCVTVVAGSALVGTLAQLGGGAGAFGAGGAVLLLVLVLHGSTLLAAPDEAPGPVEALGSGPVPS